MADTGFNRWACKLPQIESVTEIVDGVRVAGSGAILAAEETDALGNAAVNGSRTTRIVRWDG